MAPEVIKMSEDNPYTFQSDVYAFGNYELKVPFSDKIGKESSSVVAQEILASLIENKSANLGDRKFGGYELEDWGWRKYDRIPELFSQPCYKS